MPEETATRISQQPSIELSNEMLTFNHADSTRTVVTAQLLSTDVERLLFAQLVISQAVANAVSQLAQALGNLTQQPARDPEAIIDSVLAKVTAVMGLPGTAPTRGGAV